MKDLSMRTIGLAALAVLVVGALFGAVAAGALDRDSDDDEPAATVATREATGPVDAAATVAGAPIAEADDRPLGEAEAAAVARAALRIAGDGTVTDIDRSDDLGEAYEVEIHTSAGELDIALDADLERVPNLRYDD